MAVVAAVGDVEADLVQPCGPLQREVRERFLELPGLARLFQKVACARLDALGLLGVHVVALLHGAHGALARILALVAAEHVVEQALAHRPVGDLHLLHVEDAEDFREDGKSAREHRAAILGDGLEIQFARVSGLHAVLDRAL